MKERKKERKKERRNCRREDESKRDQRGKKGEKEEGGGWSPYIDLPRECQDDSHGKKIIRGRILWKKRGILWCRA